MTFIFVLAGFVFVATGYRLWRRTRHFLHVFQLEGYKLNEFRAWLSVRGLSAVVGARHAVAVSALGALTFAMPLKAPVIPLSAILVLWLVFFGSAREYRADNDKKPLVYTARMKRLLAFTVAAAMVLFGLVSIPFPALSDAGLIAAGLAGFLSIEIAAPLLVLLSGGLASPLEKRIQDGFKQAARTKIRAQHDLTVVGITGSYGKTSVKFITAEILAQQYSVLPTPDSYNTPMGICKVINQQLSPAHQFLILEMGARYPGDIAELCAIAAPDIAVLSSIGVAHLETMGSLEAIAATKAEILQSVGKDGVVVTNGDDPVVMTKVQESGVRSITVSIVDPQADVFASSIGYDTEGCRFTVHHTGQQEEMRARLLGAHNVTNILLGIGVGLHCGLSLRQIRHAVARVSPIPHRLQLRNEGPITIIDDAFNSNPVGARNAVEILGQFSSGRRIIVTPGMVELGAEQDAENRRLGQYMADHIDLAVLVGIRQTQPIKEGLVDAGFAAPSIHIFRTLFEAREFLAPLLVKGDVVLYENDLPDQYDESP